MPAAPPPDDDPAATAVAVAPLPAEPAATPDPEAVPQPVQEPAEPALSPQPRRTLSKTLDLSGEDDAACAVTAGRAGRGRSRQRRQRQRRRNRGSNDRGRAAAVAACGAGRSGADAGLHPQANSQARWQRPWVRGALGASALLLGLGLLAQMGALRSGRGALARAEPGARALCQCSLQAPRQLEALVVDNTTLKRPQESAGFQLGVTLRNKATHRIAAPHIELSLTDTRGQVVLRRGTVTGIQAA